jgi:ankyrin repeat protein
MTTNLESLPPELVLHIAEFLDRHEISCVIRAATFLYALLQKPLYKREVAQGRLIGLVYSIRAGAITAVSKFIAAGANVNAMIDMCPDIEDFVGYTTPLATAVVRGRREVIRLLLEKGARANTTFNGILCYSVLDHLWAGAARNTPLSIALALGRTDIALDLVAKMDNPDAVVLSLAGVDYTALEQATLCLRFEVVRQLLEKGADPNRQRHRDRLVVLHALLDQYKHRNGYYRVRDGEILLNTFLTLLEYGADPFIQRPCMTHPSDMWPPGCLCNLTACKLGLRSPYYQVRRHFSDILHRQECNSAACRDNRDKHGTPREAIPGHCQGYIGEPAIYTTPSSFALTRRITMRLRDADVGTVAG